MKPRIVRQFGMKAGRQQIALSCRHNRTVFKFRQHLDAGTDFDIYGLQLAWFDRWLKDDPTGIDHTSKPLHLYQLGANRWVDTANYPVSGVTPSTYYLAGGPSGSSAPSGNDGVLTRTSTTSAAGADQVTYSPGTSPCSRGTEQWGAGGLQLVLDEGMLPPDPCAQNDLTLQSGPGALTYTTAPFRRPTSLAGPIDATMILGWVLAGLAAAIATDAGRHRCYADACRQQPFRDKISPSHIPDLPKKNPLPGENTPHESVLPGALAMGKISSAVVAQEKDQCVRFEFQLRQCCEQLADAIVDAAHHSSVRAALFGLKAGTFPVLNCLAITPYR